MSANGDIYITISDTRGSGGGDSPDKPDKPDKPKKSDKQKTYDYISHLALDFLKSEVKQVINTGISNIGNFTGNYQAQRDIQSAVSGLTKLSGIVVATLAGAKYGPPGAAAGAIISTLSTVSSNVMGLISYEKQLKNSNEEINQLRIRAGLSPLTNGGRTG